MGTSGWATLFTLEPRRALKYWWLFLFLLPCIFSRVTEKASASAEAVESASCQDSEVGGVGLNPCRTRQDPGWVLKALNCLTAALLSPPSLPLWQHFGRANSAWVFFFRRGCQTESLMGLKYLLQGEWCTLLLSVSSWQFLTEFLLPCRTVLTPQSHHLQVKQWHTAAWDWESLESSSLLIPSHKQWFIIKSRMINKIFTSCHVLFIPVSPKSPLT